MWLLVAFMNVQPHSKNRETKIMKFLTFLLHKIYNYQLQCQKSLGNRPIPLRSGLTLIELAIVMLVLGVIMSIVYANLNPGSALDKAKILQVRQAASILETHLHRYELENQTINDGQPLTILTQSNGIWKGIKQELIMDPWKKPYFICSSTNGERHICTYGSDGVPGGKGQNEDFYLTDQSSWPSWLASDKKKQ